jgi:hypothetical protein
LKIDNNINDIAMDIPLEMINSVEQSTTMVLQDENFSNNESDNEQPLVNNEILVPTDSILFHNNVIKDIKDKQIDSKANIITDEGIIMEVPKKHCHCGKYKLYKNCHAGDDFIGEYGSDKVFYCDIVEFKKRFHCEVVDNKPEVNNITKKMEQIFI